MPSFIYDGSTSFGAISGTVFPKSDKLAVPTGESLDKWVKSNDWNILSQALLDVKAAMTLARYFGLTEQSTDPAPSGYGGVGQPGYLWSKSSDHSLHYKVNGTDTALGGGGGGISGSGTTGKVPVFTGASAIGDSNIAQSGSLVAINDTASTYALRVKIGAASTAVMSIQNTDTAGYSATHFRDAAGNIVGGCGYGNSAVSAGAVASRIYLASAASTALALVANDNVTADILINGGVQEIVLNDGIRYKNASKSANYNIQLADYQILCTAGAFTLTLPSPSTAGAGTVFWIVDTGGNFGSNNLTLARNGSEKINGTAGNATLTVNRGVYRVTTDGTDWFVGVMSASL